MPNDVRLYFTMRYLEQLLKNARSKEEKDKIIGGAMSMAYEDWVPMESTDFIIRTCFQYVDPARPLPLPKGPYPTSPSEPDQIV